MCRSKPQSTILISGICFYIDPYSNLSLLLESTFTNQAVAVVFILCMFCTLFGAPSSMYTLCILLYRKSLRPDNIMHVKSIAKKRRKNLLNFHFLCSLPHCVLKLYLLFLIVTCPLFVSLLALLSLLTAFNYLFRLFVCHIETYLYARSAGTRLPA